MTIMLRLLGEVQERLDIASREDPALLDRRRRELDPRQLMQACATTCSATSATRS